MFARIDRARFHPDQSDEVIRVAQESLDHFRGLPGFQRITYLYDRTSGWGFGLSLWSNQQDANAAAGRYANVAQQFAPYAIGESNDDPARNRVDGPLQTFEVIAET